VNPNRLANHVLLSEPKLSFHPERRSDVHIHPLRGLIEFGPYSKGHLLPDPVRVATLAPNGESSRLYDFLKELNSSYAPRERQDYLPPWPGFQQVFRARMTAAGSGCHQELDAQFDKDFEASSTPHIVLAAALTRAVQKMDGRRNLFDVLFIYLPDRWQMGFTGGPDEDFNLHDHMKAVTASAGMPVQIVREGSGLSYSDRASVMWRIGLALYAKAGGVPWKLAHTEPETAYIGLSYAVRPRVSGKPRFVTCCSQVFDADGAGVEFIAYDTNECEVQRENPFLSRAEMFKVMNRAMDLYRRRHAGRVPRRVMVHKTTEFKLDEIDGCMEAFHLCEAVDLIQVVEDVGWRGALHDPPTANGEAQVAPYPVKRGTLLGLGPYDALLWTHGAVGGISNRPYFQGSRSTPRPIRLVRHAGHGTWDEAAWAVLALSKMDWNNDALYNPLPVTLEYAKVLSQVVKRMDRLGTTPYQFRFFM
jgi:hypothetical protein